MAVIEMPIVVTLDRVMREKTVSLNELAAQVGITNVNLSHMKVGKIRAVRFSTLDPLCECLGCQPGDLLAFKSAEDLTDGDIVCYPVELR